MSRDAYMDVGGRATQDAKAEDRTSVATRIQQVIVLAGFCPGFRRGDSAGMTKPGLIRGSLTGDHSTPY